MSATEGRNALSNKAIVDLRKIAKKVLGAQESQGEYGGGAHLVSNCWRFAKISSGSAIVIGSLASPSGFLFDIWLPTGTSGGGAFAVSTDSSQLGVQGYNRFNVMGAAGQMIRVEYKHGEWTLIDVNCP